MPTLPHPSDDTFLMAAAELLPSLQQEAESVIVLAPSGASSTRRVQAARHANDLKRVLPLPLDLPDSALAGLATLLSELGAAEVPAGAVVGYPDILLQHVAVLGRTSSVASLSVSGATLRTHALSLLPGTSFNVALAPAQAVTRQAGDLAGSVQALDGPVSVVSSGDERYAGGLLDLLGRAEVAERRHVSPEPTTTRWWRARRSFEMTLVPVDVSGIAARLRSSITGTCKGCGDVTVAGACQFCSSVEAA